MVVVSDTGPLLHLSEANLLETLDLLDEVHVPPQVLAELALLSADWPMPAWLAVAPLHTIYAAQAQAWLRAELLDAGEAEAIALVQQLDADWLLTDDSAARLFAGSLGIEVHGSLGVLLWAAGMGYLEVDSAFSALQRLAATSLWLSKRVVVEAQAALAEILKSRES